MTRPAVRSLAVNPLRMSQPLGGALAFLGLDRCMPCFHGSQGCTAFGLVLLVRHFREAIPLQTTAMDQVSTILGGAENLEAAILNIYERTHPAVIGVCTTGVTETKGEDMAGALVTFRQRHPELCDLALVFVSTPDYVGGLEQGYAAAVGGIIDSLVEPHGSCVVGQVNVLAGSHLTPGDIDELRDVIEAFGLRPIMLPDLGGSMSGRQPDQFAATTLGGTTLEQIRSMGRSQITLVVGEHLRAAGDALQHKTGVPTVFFDRLTGLEPCDRLIRTLMELSGRPVPQRLRRQRESLVDAMLDGHFYFGRKRVVLALEPDLLYVYAHFLAGMGCSVIAAVAPTPSSVLDHIDATTVKVGDHSDAEALAAGADLIISNSHARQGAERRQVPLLRAGFPTFDRLGAAHRAVVGYRGTRDLIFEIGNLFLAGDQEHGHAVPPSIQRPQGDFSKEVHYGRSKTAAAG
ncbi:MAG: nitrogenase iron-molybdenum cofactor biosynthesis protein NifN [Azospirillum sp.]|nr:nitrogenase iron-molybdenum cofactor biosynthesis protein NifN [Azospirillum sp.]